MAEGNLGGLSFSLGVQDNVSRELNNIITKFTNMDISVNKATDSIRKLSAKLREANDLEGNGPSKEMLKMANAVDGAATRIVRLRSEFRKVSDAINQIKAIPNFMKDANLMSSLNKLQGYLRTLNSIDGSKLLDGNRIQAVFSNGARSIQEANASLKAYKETAKQAEKAVEGNARAARDLASAFRQANDVASKTSGLMSDMKSLLLQGGIVYGAQQFANSIIQTGGEIAQQHIALRNIIGDARKADELFAQTQQLALESPFKFGELNRDVKQLAAFGVEADNLYDTTKRLADVASGLGVSFERLGLAYGQVKSRSWLDGKELRQFAYAGLPLLERIKDLYNETGKDGRNNYTTKDIRDMITKRQVSFEDVDSVIKKLTDEGGQFYNMQYVLSDTLLGRWNKLIDAWDIMLGKFADGKSMVGGFFMTAINGAVALVQSIDKLGPVLLAAFSGVALKKLSSSIGGGLTGSLLSSKQSLAAKYQEKALMGELSAEERRILSTKTQITVKDLETLATTKAITSADLQRAYVARQITTEQYKQISALIAEQRHTVTLAARFRFMRMQVRQIFTANYWQNFGARGMAAFSLLKAGAMSLGRTLWAAIGGLPGLLISVVSMLVADWMQESEEIKQVADNIAQSTKQTYDDLKKYIEENPINVKASVSDIADQIDKEKNILKEKVGSAYDSIIIDVNTKAQGDPNKQLELLRQYTELYARAAEKAQAMKDVFAEAASASNGYFTESVQTNLSDLEKSAKNIELITSKMSMPQLVKDAKELKADSNTSAHFKELSDIVLQADKNGLSLYQTLGLVKDKMSEFNGGGLVTNRQDLSFVNYTAAVNAALYDSNNLDENIKVFSSKLANDFQNIATDPMEQATYRILKDAWKEANNLDVVQGAYFDMKLDKAMGLKEFPSLAEDMAKDAAGRISDATRQLLATGQPLTKAAEEDIRNATNRAMDHFKATWPGNAAEIQNIIGSHKFHFNVYMHVVGDQSATQGALDSFYKGDFKFGDSLLLRPEYRGGRKQQFSQNGESYYHQWTNGGSSPDDVEKKGKEAVDKALEIYNSAVRQRGKLAAAPYFTALTNIRSAFKEVIGYAYAGEASGITKKNNQKAEQARKAAERAKRAAETAKRKREAAAERARRKWEREQRQILKGWQNRKRLLEEYYDTWDKWRKIEGKDAAKIRLLNDKRFEGVNKDFTNPEDLAGNLSKLVQEYEKLVQTEDQRNFIAETRADAAKKEANIEYQNAERNVEMLNEQLDKLSKQYELYQKLSKVTNSELAIGLSFGPDGVYRAKKGSYYEYLRDRLNAMQGEPTARDFVDNSIPDTPKEGLIDNTLVVGHMLKAVDFGEDGLNGVLKLTDNQIQDKFGSEISKLIIDFKKESERLDDNLADILVKGFEHAHDYRAELETINHLYNEQIKRLNDRNKLTSNDPKYLSHDEVMQAEIVINQERDRELSTAKLKESDNSLAYANLFGALSFLKSEEVEKYVSTIHDIVDKAFNEGALTAKEYSERIKQLREQMSKVYKNRSDLFAYFNGGTESLFSNIKERHEGALTAAINKKEKAQDDYRKSLQNSDLWRALPERMKVQAADKEIAKQEKYLKSLENLKRTVDILDNVVSNFNNSIQSLKQFIDQLADDLDTLGGNGDSIRDSKGYEVVSGIAESSQGFSDSVKAAKEGNVVGTLAGIYHGFTGFFTGSARARDARLDRQIQLSERQLKALDNLQDSIEQNLKNTLGGIYSYKSRKEDVLKLKEGLDNYSLAKRGVRYGKNTKLVSYGAGAALGAASGLATGAILGASGGPIGAAIGAVVGALIGGLFGHKKKKKTTIYGDETFTAMDRAYQTQEYYDQQYAIKLMELDQARNKLTKERKKRKKDEEKIADYEHQVAELERSKETFGIDSAKSLYDIDLKSWAKELTNAIVGAWSKGEDAAKSFHDKVRDLMKNLTTNILSQKILENSLKGVERLINDKMKAKSGKLDENDIWDLAERIEKESSSAIDNMSRIFDALKAKGLDLSQNGSSSIGNSIKSVTEETANILASYLNAIRLDVSVDRVNIQKIADVVANMPEMNGIAQSQLTQLTTLVSLAQYRNGRLDDMYSWMRSVTKEGGTKHLSV